MRQRCLFACLWGAVTAKVRKALCRGYDNSMDFKQSTIGEILDSEREMVMHGADRYGPYFVNAAELNSLLGTGMVKSIKGDRFVFALFLGHVKKYHTLALFSAVRLHRVQAVMNLRQVLEAGACAAYAIANTDPADFADVKEDGTLDPSQKLTNKRYEWLDKNTPEGSAGIKRVKSAINESGAHANIVTAHDNFRVNFEAGRFDSPFFDYDDNVLVMSWSWKTGQGVKVYSTG